MPSVRRIAAVLLLTVWLPALLHCRLESYVGLDCCAEAAATHNEGAGCEADLCVVLETGFVKGGADQVAAPPPRLSLCLADPLLLADGPYNGEHVVIFGRPETDSAPPEIIRSRHFLTRAALPGRAPDSVS